MDYARSWHEKHDGRSWEMGWGLAHFPLMSEVSTKSH